MAAEPGQERVLAVEVTRDGWELWRRPLRWPSYGSHGAIAAAIGTNGGGLWDRVAQAAYLESDTPNGPPFTGRQFTNDEVYRSGHEQQELRRGEEKAEGILHYVRMRHDSARTQLVRLRGDHPAGASGATFPATLESLP